MLQVSRALPGDLPIPSRAESHCFTSSVGKRESPKPSLCYLLAHLFAFVLSTAFLPTRVYTHSLGLPSPALTFGSQLITVSKTCGPITLAPLIPAMPQSRYLCCVDQHWEEWWDQDECPIAAQHKVFSTESFCPNPLLLHGFIFRKEGNSLARVSFPFLERSTWSESYAFVGVNELCFCTCSPVGCNGMWRDFPLNLGSPHQSILEVPTGPEQQQHWYNTSSIQLPRNLLGFISDWQADFPNLWTA